MNYQYDLSGGLADDERFKGKNLFWQPNFNSLGNKIYNLWVFLKLILLSLIDMTNLQIKGNADFLTDFSPFNLKFITNGINTIVTC